MINVRGKISGNIKSVKDASLYFIATETIKKRIGIWLINMNAWKEKAGAITQYNCNFL